MKGKINKTDIINCFKSGGKFIGTIAFEAYGEMLNQEGEEAFVDAIEIGIKNTIAALYEAKVNDQEIVRVVNVHWGISIKDAEERLIWEKQQAVIRTLQQYLKLQGLSNSEVEKFMCQNKVAIAIRYDRELWKLKDKPEKLIKIIKGNNVRGKKDETNR